MNSREEIVKQYRNHWTEVPIEKKEHRILFSIFHGLVERTTDDIWDDRKAKYFIERLTYFKKNIDSIPSDDSVLVQLLNEHIGPAYDLGLPVKTPKDMGEFEHFKGTFGVIQTIEDGKARISMYVQGLKNKDIDPEVPLMDVAEPPLDSILEPYRIPGAWLCHVEYKFGSFGCEGSFEPACNLEM